MRLGIIARALVAASLITRPADAAKTLVFCSEASPDIFNPQVGITGTTFDAGQPIYSRLVAFEPGTLNIVPDLAEFWTISDGGKTYPFHLRRGVKWQSNPKFKPSREFNADDVLFTFNREWSTDNAFDAVSGGHYNYWTGDNGDPDNFFNVLLSCTAALQGRSTGAKWCNKEFDDVIRKAKRVTHREERTKFYRRAQEIMHDEAPIAPIAQSIVFETMRKEVLNYKMPPLNRRDFADVDLQE